MPQTRYLPERYPPNMPIPAAIVAALPMVARALPYVARGATMAMDAKALSGSNGGGDEGEEQAAPPQYPSNWVNDPGGSAGGKNMVVAPKYAKK